VEWLGAGNQLAGRTKFCTEPASLRDHVPALGGTKNPDIARIVVAAPDLVLANKEENRREDIEALEAAGLRVLLTDPNTVDEAVAMIREVGEALGAGGKADRLIGEIRVALEGVASPPGPLSGLPSGEGEERLRVYVGVWHNPMMGLGSESYGHSLMEACGAVNALGGRPRYPAVSLDELEALKPDLILLPDEPFPFDDGHARAYAAVAPVRLIDGKLLWWYGPRMPAAIRELRTIFEEARL